MPQVRSRLELILIGLFFSNAISTEPINTSVYVYVCTYIRMYMLYVIYNITITRLYTQKRRVNSTNVRRRVNMAYTNTCLYQRQDDFIRERINTTWSIFYSLPPSKTTSSIYQGPLYSLSNYYVHTQLIWF